ncbi:MAG: hypothetical protein JO021_19830, partial [Alphaproteobacteria bacterium]|nr:hypothetical protein [Alphaproteobacteria bacterium]
MSGVARNSTSRWRKALRVGALAAALGVVAGVPLAAQAHDGWRGHERHEGWRHEWREHHPYWGYYGPRYYAPAYGYYAPGYYAPAPG